MNPVKLLARTALGRRLPTHEGTLRLPRARAGLTIGRDRFGVPYVDAPDTWSAWYGLGFCHAQDRAGQMEIIVRAVRGTLAEVAGEETVGVDRLARRIGFARAAKAQLAVADADVLQQLAAYCDGVNDGLTRGGEKVAHEFALLGCEPTPWVPADVQGYFCLLCFALASNWDMELLRLRVLDLDGADALRDIDPAYLAELPLSHPPGAPSGATDRLADDLELFHSVVGMGGGSNAWAIAPERTRTGRPLLANDPHLNPAVPCSWYLARVQCPEFRVAGATFVGIPAMGSGHNGHAAWGITAAHADNTDLFIEDVGPDGVSVREGDAWVPCDVIEERIRVKGAPDVLEQVLVTRRGPIVSPAFEGEARALSLAATWLQPRPYRGFYGVHAVKSFDDFREQFRQGSTAAGAVVYADADGHIGWVFGVEVPQRRSGHGHLPMPAWHDGTGWHDEPVPFDDMPYSLDPECGFVSTANNQPVAHEGAPFLGVDWLDGYRQAGIAERLGSRDDWDVDSSMQLQKQVTSLPWREVGPIVTALDGGRRPARIALDLLRAWDGEVSGDSAAATTYVFFMAEMSRRFVAERAPNTMKWALGHGFTALLPYNLMVTRRFSHVVRMLREQPQTWFHGSWDDEMLHALDAVVLHLRDRYGDDTSAWAWGTVRPLRLVHMFGEKKPLDAIFNVGPVPYEGDATTVAQAAVDLHDPAANPVGVATLRHTIDVGDWDRSRYSLVHGQSGNPYSPHYDDMLPIYLRGQGVPIAWADAEVKRAVTKKLRIEPL